MVKKFFALLLVMVVLGTSAVVASATNTPPKVDAPYGIVYKVYNDTVAERVSISCLFTDDYADMMSLSNEETQQKFGYINAGTYVQIDYRIDGGEWHSDEIWDTTPNAAHYGGNVPSGDTVRTFDLLYLINKSDLENAGDLATTDEKGRTVFDLENHTLEFRMRTSMIYTTNITNVTTSEWTEVIKVERDKDFGKAPEELEAPLVGKPQVDYLENSMPYLSFSVRTPESIKKAEAWLSTQEPTYISMLVEIDKGTGTWESANFSVSSGHFVNEMKGVYLNAVDVADAANMRIRVRYVAYLKDKTLYSDYSDVLEFSVPRWEDGKGVLHEKCKVCGICKPVFGQCMFVVGGIVLLAAVVVAVPVKMNVDKVKARKAAEEEERQRRIKAERAAYDKSKKDKKNKNKKG